MLLRLFLVLALLVASPAYAEEISIEQAYAAVPHARTPYDLQQSQAPEADAKYLDHLFFVTDMALRARIQTMQSMSAGNAQAVERYDTEIENLLASFELVQTPPKLQKVQATIIAAIKEQQGFFKEWAATAGTEKYEIIKNSIRRQKLVLSSHQKLVHAYGQLKQLYPGESANNQQAFFDHLCALDFI